MRQIFVFGSNREGRHGKGAALEARLNHGAIYGQAEGLQGNSYAIITKELRWYKPKVSLMEVTLGVHRFLDFARNRSDLEFLVTKIGCGLAGFTVQEIAPLFNQAPINVRVNTDFSREISIQGGDPWIPVKSSYPSDDQPYT